MDVTSPLGGQRRLRRSPIGRVWRLRLVLLAGFASAWEVVARSGILFEDVVPSIAAIGGALTGLTVRGAFYADLAASVWEVVAGVAIGGIAGLAAGIFIGGSSFATRAFEPYLKYLAPMPKIVFFPMMVMWFGIGLESKIAIGTVSSFFPVALSAASGRRHIDEVLINVGRSFGATWLQMVKNIYLPAMVVPVLNGVRLGLGVSFVGVLLAEMKLSSRGLGFLIRECYDRFDMPEMYAILIIVFIIAAAMNSFLEKFEVWVHSRR